MNEFELIGRLTKSLPTNASVIVGAGDDCAVLDCGHAEKWLLFKTDAVVEEIHFQSDTPGERIGHKALARCLSDIAAMAGTPTAALVTIGLPKDYDVAGIEAIYRGMNQLALRCGLAIVGGETTTSPERLFLSISVIGEVPKGKCLLRSGAKDGDAIFVTGELGGSLSGRHLDFEPRLKQARWLAAHWDVHAMMDLSDGLAGDLRHILQASACGAELLARAIPVGREAKRAARENTSAKPPLLAALADGEDFELVFTVASHDAVPLLDGWKAQFTDLKLSCIGKITREPGLRIRDERGVRTLNDHGYIHFTQPG